MSGSQNTPLLQLELSEKEWRLLAKPAYQLAHEGQIQGAANGQKRPLDPTFRMSAFR